MFSGETYEESVILPNPADQDLDRDIEDESDSFANSFFQKKAPIMTNVVRKTVKKVRTVPNPPPIPTEDLYKLYDLSDFARFSWDDSRDKSAY